MTIAYEFTVRGSKMTLTLQTDGNGHSIITDAGKEAIADIRDALRHAGVVTARLLER